MHIEFHQANTRERIAVSLASNQEYIIGSDKSSGIVFEDPGVCARHARIIVADRGLSVEPIDQAPISLNGHPLTGSVPLGNGDWLALGTTLFQIGVFGDPQAERAAQEEIPPAKPGPRNDLVTIGRLPECDIEIPSPLVSREHARLVGDSGNWVLEDLHSTNGTFVNEQRLVTRTP